MQAAQGYQFNPYFTQPAMAPIPTTQVHHPAPESADNALFKDLFNKHK